MDRTILHIDMNSFYASVELLSRPDLANQPVVVGGDESQRRGIVLAKNDIAKGFGIKTAETLHEARRKAPGLVVLPPHHDLYHDYSQKAKQIYLTYSERVQSFGPDEAWIDVTHLQKNGRALAEEIRQRIRRELGLTVSIGVSWNKTFAKMGSDHRKPDAVTVIDRENYRTLLWPKPVEELIFVGRATAARLHSIGIGTIGELAKADEVFLGELLGKHGVSLVRSARGDDDSPVLTEAEQGPPKSIGAMETTRQDLTREEELKALFRKLAEEVTERLAEAGMRTRTVRIVVRDSDFITKTRQRSLPVAVTQVDDIFNLAWAIYQAHFHIGLPVRLLGVTLDQLEDVNEPEQMSLLDLVPTQKAEKTPDPELTKLLAELQERFGAEQIRRGFSDEA